MGTAPVACAIVVFGVVLSLCGAVINNRRTPYARTKRQIFREQVLPHAGGKIPEAAFRSDRLALNRLNKEGIAVPDGVLFEARHRESHWKSHRHDPDIDAAIVKLVLRPDGRYTPPEGRYPFNNLVESTYVIRPPINIHGYGGIAPRKPVHATLQLPAKPFFPEDEEVLSDPELINTISHEFPGTRLWTGFGPLFHETANRILRHSGSKKLPDIPALEGPADNRLQQSQDSKLNTQASNSVGVRTNVPSSTAARPWGYYQVYPKVNSPPNHQVISPPNHQGNSPTNHHANSPPNHQGNSPTNHHANSPPNHQGNSPTNHHANSPPNHQGNSPTNHQANSPPNHQDNLPPNHKPTPQVGSPTYRQASQLKNHRYTLQIRTPSNHQNPEGSSQQLGEKKPALPDLIGKAAMAQVNAAVGADLALQTPSGIPVTKPPGQLSRSLKVIDGITTRWRPAQQNSSFQPATPGPVQLDSDAKPLGQVQHNLHIQPLRPVHPAGPSSSSVHPPRPVQGGRNVQPLRPGPVLKTHLTAPSVGYPSLDRIPDTSYVCRSRTRSMEADPQTNCQVFHLCHPDGRKESFLCPVGFRYNAKSNLCTPWTNIPCPPDT